jgi:hypothetical protein
MLCSSGSLDFFRLPKNKITTIKITMFRKLVLLPSSGKRRGKRGPNRVCVPLFPLLLPEDGSRTSFRNVLILIVVILFFGRWKKSKDPLLHNK